MRRLMPATILFGGALVPSIGHAAPWTANSFEIRHFITDADGAQLREMDEVDLNGFINRARCECGQRIQTMIWGKGDDGDDLPLQALIGPMCGTAEPSLEPAVQRCVELAAG